MPIQPFGKADPYYDALRVLSNQNLQGAAIGDTIISGSLLNRIYLWPTDGTTLSDYDPTEAGLTAALTAAVSGDSVVLPSIAIALTAGITLPTGVILMGLSEGSILNFSGFAGTAITMAASAVCDHFVFNFTPSGDDSIGLDARFDACVVNHVRGYLIGALTTSRSLHAGVS